MEFNEKLQELRKNRSMTQEELAEALFVSRTAISKWESGRGYPSIDSLKEISKFFGVSIDELICSEEMISVAQNEKKEYIRGSIALISSLMDVLLLILLIIPIYGNGSENWVSVFDLDVTNSWIKILMMTPVFLTVIFGVAGVVAGLMKKPRISKAIMILSFAATVFAEIVFILTRQPYAGIIVFLILMIKMVLILWKFKS